MAWRQALGPKAVVLEQLKGVVDQPFVSLDEYIAAGGSPAVAAPKSGTQQWESIDAAKIDRPVFSGPDKFVPKAELGFTPSTHPFKYMEAFYPNSIK